MKKLFLTIAAVLILCSMPMIFLNIEGVLSIYTNEVKGTTFTIIGVFLIIVSLYGKNNTSKILCYIAYFIGISITTVALIKVFTEASTLNYRFGIGFYMYYLSVIPVIISLIFKEKTDKQDEIDKKLDEENVKVDDPNIFYGIYLYGIKNKPEYGNKTCALTYQENNTVLNLRIINNEEIIQENILINEISKITVTPTVVTQTIKQEFNDASAKRKILAYSILNSSTASLLLASGVLDDKHYEYDKYNYSTIYNIQIDYNKDKELSKVVITSEILPTEFFKDLNDKYEEKK